MLATGRGETLQDSFRQWDIYSCAHHHLNRVCLQVHSAGNLLCAQPLQLLSLPAPLQGYPQNHNVLPKPWQRTRAWEKITDVLPNSCREQEFNCH